MKLNKKGFSLMELLIVAIVIAGFAAFTYPSYVSSIERARVSEAVQMLATIQAAQQKHFVNYEKYGEIFKDINDFTPAIDNFNPNNSAFSTEYFTYELTNQGYALATRINKQGTAVNKGYQLEAYYEDDFIRCVINDSSEDGEKVCSSLTDKNKVESGSYYPIY